MSIELDTRDRVEELVVTDVAPVQANVKYAQLHVDDVQAGAGERQVRPALSVRTTPVGQNVVARVAPRRGAVRRRSHLRRAVRVGVRHLGLGSSRVELAEGPAPLFDEREVMAAICRYRHELDQIRQLGDRADVVTAVDGHRFRDHSTTSWRRTTTSTTTWVASTRGTTVQTGR